MTDSNGPEFVFPPYAIPALHGMRGEEWDELVESCLQGQAGGSGQEVSQAAFVLMMVRLAGCVTCQADSFRAMRGCIPCSRQVVRRYTGEDAELSRQYEAALLQVEKHCAGSEKFTTEPQRAQRK